MESYVFAIVLLAALLHASWNSVIKVGNNPSVTMVLLGLVSAAIAIPILPFVPVPAPASWIWIAVSAFLHTSYNLSLMQAYRRAQLSQVYPIARGAAPLIVMLVSILFLDSEFHSIELAAILIISIGILLLSITGKHARISVGALSFAFCTAGLTACYTLADGIGARLAQTSSGYILWMFAGDGLLMALWAMKTQGRAIIPDLQKSWKQGVAAGAMSVGSYWIAVWAFTQAPIAMVAALRESSILFASLIAYFILREPMNKQKWTSVLLIAAGVALMRL